MTEEVTDVFKKNVRETGLKSRQENNVIYYVVVQRIENITMFLVTCPGSLIDGNSQ